MAGTQYIKTNTVKTHSVGINIFFEEMHTRKSECQVRVVNNIIKYIETGDTNMGIVQAHPSTCVRNKNTRDWRSSETSLRCLGQHRKPTSNYLHVITTMNLTYLFAGWECHCILFQICSFFHIWVFGLLQASRGVVCANNRYVAFAFVFA